ncbi:MAG: DUF1648 domain-containing protein [Ardenticatenaceae bacterium]|nr:DUF1648 domain-containing protein [Ardenticatenaceae bacterium]
MLESQPSTSPGTIFGFSCMVGFILLDVVLFMLLIRGPITLLSFLLGVLLLASLPLLAVVAYWTSSLSTTRYHVVENALLIEWGSLRQVIPLAAIESLQPGGKITQFRGLRWPGLMIGRGQIDGQVAVVFATRPAAEQLLLKTETAVYAISPVDLENFKNCLEALRTAEMAEPVDLPESHLGFLSWSFWNEWPAHLLLAASGLLNLALFGYLTAVYNHLPAQVPLHFNQLGQVDRLAAPNRLFLLPLIGLTVWLVNGTGGWFFYQQSQKLPAYLLWGTAVLVQLAIWGAVFPFLN